MRETPLKVLSHFVHPPWLVHLRDRVIIISHRFIALGLDNPIEVLKESRKQFVVESMNGQLGIVGEALF